MNSLRTTLLVPALLGTGLLTSLALAGCPGDTSTNDAGRNPEIDAFTVELDAPSTDDAALSPADCSCVDALPDAVSTTDAPAPDAGPVVGDSFVARTCGPADGAALTITISDALDVATCSADPEMPSTGFYIHDLGGATLPPTAGATITSTTAASNGTATECPGGHPPCRLTETWSISFTSYADDGGASGQYVIMWEGGETSTGTFQATRCEVGGVICG